MNIPSPCKTIPSAFLSAASCSPVWQRTLVPVSALAAPVLDLRWGLRLPPESALPPRPPGGNPHHVRLPAEALKHRLGSNFQKPLRRRGAQAPLA